MISMAIDIGDGKDIIEVFMDIFMDPTHCSDHCSIEFSIPKSQISTSNAHGDGERHPRSASG
jgi:hypothetical protein